VIVKREKIMFHIVREGKRTKPTEAKRKVVKKRNKKGKEAFGGERRGKRLGRPPRGEEKVLLSLGKDKKLEDPIKEKKKKSCKKKTNPRREKREKKNTSSHRKGKTREEGAGEQNNEHKQRLVR